MAVRKLNQYHRSAAQGHRRFDAITFLRLKDHCWSPCGNLGRNNQGRADNEVYRWGHKRKYRIIDSNGTRMGYLLLSIPFSTIPIVRPTLHFFG